jgi:PAS domain S-box-containing protein
MPRVDGIEVLRRIKSDNRTKDIPVVILTGSKEDRDLKNAYALGVTSYITKPFKSEQFVLLMSELGAKFDAIERKVRILVLEDNPQDSELIMRELKKSICNIDFKFARDKNAFHDALDNFAPDIILTDYTVPGFNGVAAMYLARQHFPDIPTIVVSGTIGEELAVEVLKSGANDYILKSRLNRLGPVTNRALQEAKQVAERRKAEEDLARSEQRWAITLSSIGDSVIATDVDGNITFMNNIAEKLTGWSLDEALQKPLQTVFHIINEATRQQVENPVVKVLKNGCVVGLANHSILINKNGLEIPIDDTGSPITDQSGKVAGVVLVFHDITERKKIEQELDQHRKHLERLVEEKTKQLKDAERLAVIGATAGMVGHDIRNPLQAITSDVYLAKLELASCPDCEGKKNAQESLEGIENNVIYISKIVADLQDYARPIKPVIRETDIENVCNEVLTKTKLPDAIEVSCKVEDKAKLVMGDPELLMRAVSNLVTNAVQAMSYGGKLAVRAYKDDDDVVVEVQDTGVGIPEEVKPNLFTPLFTTKSKGQGFGLAVVKRMVEMMDGTVTFESEEGKGTKFIIRLPPQE